MIDAGASIVLGSGPHVIRGVERYHRRMVAYSLGNFVGYHTLGGGGVLNDSAILRVTPRRPADACSRRTGSRSRSWTGCRGPTLRDASAKLVAALSREDFPLDHFDIGANGVFRHRMR